MSTTGMARFDAYGPPKSIAGAVRAVDGVVDEATVLRRENHRLRSEKANILACLEAERAEVARLRRENQRLSAPNCSTPTVAGEPIVSGPATVKSPTPAVHLPDDPAGVGHPNLTVGELEDAAYAVRQHMEQSVAPHSAIGCDAWTHLAEKLAAAALSK